MEIKQRYIENCVIIDIKGVLDIYSHTSLYYTVNALINSGKTSIIIDMKNVQYIDSTGIGALVSLVKLSKTQSFDLRFADVQETVKQRLELSKLYTFLPVAATVEDAVKELNG